MSSLPIQFKVAVDLPADIQDLTDAQLIEIGGQVTKVAIDLLGELTDPFRVRQILEYSAIAEAEGTATGGDAPEIQA